MPRSTTASGRRSGTSCRASPCLGSRGTPADRSMQLIRTLDEVVPLLIVTFVAAMLLAVGLTPLVRRFAISVDAIDTPDHRRVNASPVPRGGGIAVAFSFLAVVVVVLLVNDRMALVRIPFTIDPKQLVGLLAGGAVATLIGFLDDYFQLRARWQLIGQLVVAAIAVVSGVLVTYLNNPFGAGSAIALDGPYAVGFTVLWIVGMINSINFIDGLDGLSSGIALIATATLGVISLSQGEPMVALLCGVLAGALGGFMPWNFLPARVFTGTTGVMAVGYALAVLSILGTAKYAVALL